MKAIEEVPLVEGLVLATKHRDPGAGRKPPLSLGIKLGYAAGQSVDGIVSNCVTIFLMFYVTAVCGLPGGLAGVALSAGLVIDAIMDPLIGSLSDGWRSRFGRRLPFMVVGLVPIMLTFTLIFSLPVAFGQTALFLWLTLLSVTLRISLSLFGLPYQALGAELSDDYAERSSITAWRWGIGMVFTLAVILLGYGLFFAGGNGLSNRAAYRPFALTLAAIMLAGAMISIRTTYVTRDRQHMPPAAGAAILSRLLGEIAEVFRNRTFRILFFSGLLFNVAVGVATTLGLHANSYFWRLDTAQIQTVSLAAVGGLLLGAPVAMPFLNRFEKRTVMLAGMATMIVMQAGPVLLRLAGLLPFTGGPLTLVLAIVALFGGVMTTAAIIAFLSVMADAADEHEHLFGTRREGLYFAGWAFAAKAAAGAGALFAGLALQVIGFPTDIAKHGGAAAVLPEHMTNMLGIFYGPAAAVLSAAGFAIAWRYGLDRRAHDAIMTDLSVRRRAAASLVDVQPDFKAPSPSSSSEESA